MLLQNVSSTMPASFSKQRGLEICSPGPQFALHFSQSTKSHENSGLRGLFSFTPNEYLTVTFSFGRIYSMKQLTRATKLCRVRSNETTFPQFRRNIPGEQLFVGKHSYVGKKYYNDKYVTIIRIIIISRESLLKGI